MNIRRMPYCMGAYSIDDCQCNGVADGPTDDDKVPCLYRDRCVAFLKLQRLSRNAPEHFVRLRKMDDGDAIRWYSVARDESLHDELSRLMSLYDIRNGKISKPNGVVDPKPKRELTKEQRKALDRGRKLVPKSAIKAAVAISCAQARESRYKCEELAAWYIKQVSHRLRRTVSPTQPMAASGQLFLIDRFDSSGYATLCVKDYKPIPVTSVYLRPRNGLVEVRIAVAWRDYFASMKHTGSCVLENFTGKDGLFDVRARNVDRGSASFLAALIAKLADRGILRLPSQG